MAYLRLSAARQKTFPLLHFPLRRILDRVDIEVPRLRIEVTSPHPGGKIHQTGQSLYFNQRANYFDERLARVKAEHCHRPASGIASSNFFPAAVKETVADCA